MRLFLHLHRALILPAALLPGLVAAQTVYNDPLYKFDAQNTVGVAAIGYQDGPANSARFNHPDAVVTDSKGNAFVVDTGNHTIRMILPDGTVSTFAGAAGVSGSDDGMGSAARFFNPSGIGIDSADNLYVADAGNSTIRKISPSGMVATFAGSAGNSGFTDDKGTAARFYLPVGINVDGSDNIYVADAGNNIIRMITQDGTVTTVAGKGQMPSVGSNNGPRTAARFYHPTNTAVDSAGNIFVADSANHVIRKISADGTVTTLAGAAGSGGSVDGAESAARFNNPTDVAIANDGSIYVADSFNNTIRKISADGSTVTTVAGSPGLTGSVDGIGTSARFNAPSSVAVDASGNVFVSDTYNHTIRKIAPDSTVTTFAGVAGSSGAVDATGTAALFNYPTHLVFDARGNLFEADAGNHAIRKITPAAAVTTLAGLAGYSGSIDGDNSTARFDYPEGVCVDGSGDVYVADTYNCTIRKVTPDGVVSTLAGTAGRKGSLDTDSTTPPVTQFNFPSGVSIDSQGNLLVADTYNNAIRKITLTPAVVVSTYAGIAGNDGFADGTASNARFNGPDGVAVDNKGTTLFIADSGNNTIRALTPDGIVGSIAGPGLSASNGDNDGSGSAARFDSPDGIAVDPNNNVYVADTGNDSIRLLTPYGTDKNSHEPTYTVTTPIGLSQAPGRTDGLNAYAGFQNPVGIWINKNPKTPKDVGNIYIADTGNNSIRKVVADTGGVMDLVSTLAGEAINQGSVDAQGTAARFALPNGIVVSEGKIYVADTNNSTIRMIDTANAMVSTYAGTAGVTGNVDGMGTGAAFHFPYGMAADASGNLYVADQSSQTIREIFPTHNGLVGMVITLAGTANVSGSEDSATSTNPHFDYPASVAVTKDGSKVFVADENNHTIRKIEVLEAPRFSSRRMRARQALPAPWTGRNPPRAFITQKVSPSTARTISMWRTLKIRRSGKSRRRASSARSRARRLSGATSTALKARRNSMSLRRWPSMARTTSTWRTPSARSSGRSRRMAWSVRLRVAPAAPDIWTALLPMPSSTCRAPWLWTLRMQIPSMLRTRRTP